MIWLACVFMLATSVNTKHCSIQDRGFLAQNNGDIVWSTPVHLTMIEEQLQSLQKEIGFKRKDTDTHKIEIEGKTLTFSIPTDERHSITLARGKCMEMKGHSTSLENILKSGLHEKYRMLTSISFMMQTDERVKCNIQGREEDRGCWQMIEEIGKKYHVKTNISDMQAFLQTHELGLLTTKGSEIMLTTGVRSRLPCITYSITDKPETKWSLLRDNYLTPIAERSVKILDKLKSATQKRRRKRSLISSIFGFASAAETESIREALRIELKNQEKTNKAMANLLRNQIKTAKQIRKEDKVLYKLEKEELKLEEEVDSMKTFLEKAFSNSTEITTRLKQDNMAILKAFTLSQRLRNVEEQLSTILDILHCPAGRCKRILEEVMEEENIGEKDTLNLITEMAQTNYNQGRIEVTLHNITRSDRVVELKCIPFIDNNKTVRLEYNQEMAINKKGFYTISPACLRTTGVVLCPSQRAYFKDKCLENLILDGTRNKHCENKIVADERTVQDFISDENTLLIFSRVEDKVLITSRNFQERSELHKGINTFKLKNDETEVETSHMLFKVGKNTDKYLTSDETISLTKYDAKEEDNISQNNNMSIDMDELEQIETPRMSTDTDTNKFELPETVLPNPTLIFLSSPKESWYVYMIMTMATLATTFGAVLYCKCRHKLCFKTKRRSRRSKKSESNAKESESEEETKLIEQTPKYCEMTMENLGFCKEIVTLQKGKKFYWSGSSWRDHMNKLEPSFREPPSYLLGELKTFSGGCSIGMKQNMPYIHIMGYTNTNYNRALGCWEIMSEGTTRTLPSYAAPRPTEETLQKFRKTLIEHKEKAKI